MNLKCLSLSLLITMMCSDLRFVFEMYRHGARSAFVDPTKNNTDIFGQQWEGDGELTPIGMRMHYILGYRNRQRYAGFLSSSYNPSEIYIMATDVNRTIMSAQSQLDGLYPPSSGPEIPDNKTEIAVPPLDVPNLANVTIDLKMDALKYRSQVVPMHIIPTDSREFYLHNPDHCPAVGTYINENLQKQVVVDYMNQFKKNYSRSLIAALGFNESQFDDFWFNDDLTDAFVAGYFEGKNYTSLEKAGINLEEFNVTSYLGEYVGMFEANFGDKEFFVGGMSMSPLHRSIIEWMDTRVDYDSRGLSYATYKAPKLVMLSGHDSNLAAMQAYLRYVFPDLLDHFVYVPYASSLYYEFYRNSTASGYDYSDYYIDVIFNNSTMFTINYDDFREAVLDKSYSQEFIDNFCGFDNNRLFNKDGVNTTLLIISICLGVLSLTLLVTVGCLCCKKKRHEKLLPFDSIV
jgi:acid phosphatase